MVEPMEPLAPAFREMIKHENDLINQRLTWLIQGQSLLFAALGFAWGKAPMSLILLLSFIAVVTALSTWKALSASKAAVEELREAWKKNNPSHPFHQVVVGFDSSGQFGNFLYPWRVMPKMFIIAWCGVVAISLTSGNNFQTTSGNVTASACVPATQQTEAGRVSPNN